MLDLEPRLLEMVKSILSERVPRARAWAFGSRVQGRAKRFSDLDIALEEAAPIDWSRMGDLKVAFSESDLPIKVDVLDLRAISPEFRSLIEQQRVPIP